MEIFISTLISFYYDFRRKTKKLNSEELKNLNLNYGENKLVYDFYGF